MAYEKSTTRTCDLEPPMDYDFHYINQNGVYFIYKISSILYTLKCVYNLLFVLNNSRTESKIIDFWPGVQILCSLTHRRRLTIDAIPILLWTGFTCRTDYFIYHVYACKILRYISTDNLDHLYVFKIYTDKLCVKLPVVLIYTIVMFKCTYMSNTTIDTIQS